MYKWFLATLLAITLVSCPDPTGTITDISLSSDATILKTNAVTNLTAVVSGTGGFSKAVKWSKSGGGNFDFTSGVKFVAPSIAGSTEITVASSQDPSKSKTMTISTININPNSSIATVSINPPISTTLNAGAVINLTSNVTGTGAFSTSVNWTKVGGNGTLSNVSSTSLTFTAPSQATGSSTILRATSVQDASKFGDLVLNINPKDTSPPKIVSATATNSTTVVVIFNEALDPTSVAANKFSIIATPALNVSAAVLAVNNTTVTLTTATQTPNVSYAVLADSSIKDAAGNNYVPGSDVTPNAASFTGFVP
jgi:hypothetical protein